MNDALRIAKEVKVIRSLHRVTGGNIPVGKPDITKSGGGNVKGYATKGAVTDPLEIAKAHPASIIPGVHIVGHNPIFHGDE